MKIVFADSPNIDELTFKRMLLLGSEITFVERPSIQFVKDLGTVGMPSRIRGLLPVFERSPVQLRVEEPPTSSFNSAFYQEYFKVDLANSDFARTLMEGIRSKWIYSNFFDIANHRGLEEFKDF